jgi:hypothetical protein
MHRASHFLNPIITKAVSDTTTYRGKDLVILNSTNYIPCYSYLILNPSHPTHSDLICDINLDLLFPNTTYHTPYTHIPSPSYPTVPFLPPLIHPPCPPRTSKKENNPRPKHPVCTCKTPIRATILYASTMRQNQIHVNRTPTKACRADKGGNVTRGRQLKLM